MNLPTGISIIKVNMKDNKHADNVNMSPNLSNAWQAQQHSDISLPQQWCVTSRPTRGKTKVEVQGVTSQEAPRF